MITHSKKNLTNNPLVVMKTRGLLVKKLTINLFTLVFTKEIPGNEKLKKFYNYLQFCLCRLRYRSFSLFVSKVFSIAIILQLIFAF